MQDDTRADEAKAWLDDQPGGSVLVAELIEASERHQRKQLLWLTASWVGSIGLVLGLVALIVKLFFGAGEGESGSSFMGSQLRAYDIALANHQAERARADIKTDPVAAISRSAAALRVAADAGAPVGSEPELSLRASLAKTETGHSFVAPHSSAVTAVEVSLDGTRMISGGADGMVLVWTLDDTGAPLGSQRLVGHEGLIDAIAIGPSGDVVATGGQDQVILVWDLARASPRPRRLEGHTGEVTDLLFTSDGTRLLSCATDKSVRAWTRSWSDWDKELLAHGNEVVRLTLSKSESILISADVDGWLMTWSMADVSGTPMQRFAPHESEIWTLEVSSDGQFMLSGSADGNARVWSVTKAGLSKQTVVLRGHRDTINDASFSPDSLLVATGSRDGTVRLWNLETNHPEQDPRVLEVANGVTVDHVLFSPDGERLYIGAGDGAIHVWYVRRSEEQPVRMILGGHSQRLSGLVIPDDGRFLISGSLDGTTRIWPMDSDGLINLACVAMGGEPSERDWRAWFPDRPQTLLCK